MKVVDRFDTDVRVEGVLVEVNRAARSWVNTGEERAPCRWCSHRVQGPVLAGGFLDVRFSGLRDVVVVGLVTCERVVLGKGAKVIISRSAQGICPPHRRRRS